MDAQELKRTLQTTLISLHSLKKQRRRRRRSRRRRVSVSEPKEPLMSSKPPKCFYVNIFFKHERETSRVVNKT